MMESPQPAPPDVERSGWSMVACPECGRPAEVEWADLLPSADGLVEHVKIRCVFGHWFLMPAARLDARSSPAPSVASLSG